ncbi:NAD(P)/FAD-dependent oxidoreductase [Caenimonas koreensis]|uniref:flavin-containing monooxygenase n=1 Tax=Caenimonas koreensis TaxID=367474 RepID=UPI002B26C261|nr:NAD(P)/FAD-dependent oxidoreductase [Caenimonas koreensis]
MSNTTDFVDVVVVGAGLSGIAAGHYLQTLCASRSYTILESRSAIGGTWDLFRYPGVRSDSDMSTLGYSFRPWADNAMFASATTIRDYVAATAREEGIERHIRFGIRVTGADWDSQRARWCVSTLSSQGVTARIECRFVFFCSGYYDYESGYEPQWQGRDEFKGTIVHPQQWPASLDYTGKRVVVIGSGATAITLVPAMATRAAHVTMLQRSPSYIIALPAHDAIGAKLRQWLPPLAAHRMVRWKNIVGATLLFQFSRRWPEAMKRLISKGARRYLGADFDVARHLSPRYDPWDQRLCIAPDGDFFQAVRSGKADIVTGDIERFTPDGLKLASGEALDADVVVTATGLRLKMLGGAAITIDGAAVDASKSFVYRGTMYSGVPNLAVATGYTNASWTLKCELSARYVCRLLNEMQATGLDTCVPVHDDSLAASGPAIDLSSGYIQRAAATLPRQGDRTPWRMYQNYFLDLLTLKFARLRDGVLRLARGASR